MKKKIDIRGERIGIKNFKKDDISKEYISWLNDKKVTEYSNQRHAIHSYESCLSYYNSFKGTNNHFLSIRELNTNRMIGTLTIYHFVHHKTVDIGIMIGESDVWGQGYGQEAWNMTMEWLIEDSEIHKITAGTARPNKGMIKLMERSGMTLEAVKIKQEIIGGSFEDLLYFAKFNPSYNKIEKSK